ncbi:MAG: hypothetical protein ABI599_11610 [Flavobacteriales bacterium]
MQHRITRLLAIVLMLTLILSGCATSHDVVQNGIFQHRKYNHPGWFVDVPSRTHTVEAPLPVATSQDPAPLPPTMSVVEVIAPDDRSELPELAQQGRDEERIVVQDNVNASLTTRALWVPSPRNQADAAFAPVPSIDRITIPDEKASPQDAGGLDIFALLGFIFAFIFPIAGLVLSIIGMNRTRGGGRGHGLALAGLIISIVFLAIYGVAVLH